MLVQVQKSSETEECWIIQDNASGKDDQIYIASSEQALQLAYALMTVARGQGPRLIRVTENAREDVI